MPSEYGEDIWIEENLNLPDKGFYLDLGCAWTVLYSNTHFLRERGWKGLAIDGNPDYAPDWIGVEEFRNLVIGSGDTVPWLKMPNPDLSRVSRDGVPVVTTRLDELELPTIDFISCDLEGQEYNSMVTLDWKNQRPGVIISEYNTLGIGEDFRVKSLLESMGYREVHRTVANIVYVA